ncbi:hypothetical protein AM493_18460 [Flavobacterium akiainvivens]|uniref:Lipocalin-like domain-containing protein n=1 Tax=Flavobacterium akiainvivens TaxID=1202724 RepID=A0A0M8MFH1_9FLAO|nr:hypothetical protein [Flavobacterium akiainvivens]KOS07814.1 hypothetical protein AM493_18460 [Flavobacterium akiainvivens]SFQ26895.1 hypothetical protein SAMN05444144_102274 [Flavobacterium akiainvivens]
MKLLYLLILFVTALSATAQVAEKDIAGRWKLVSCNDGSAIIDAEKGTFVLDAGYVKSLSAAELTESERDYRILVKQYANAYLDFKQGKVQQQFGEDVYSGTYKLETFEEDELTITDEEGEITYVVDIKDGKLHVSNYEEGYEMVYKKVK